MTMLQKKMPFFGLRVFVIALLTLTFCGAVFAAPPEFVERKGESGLLVDVPIRWQIASKDFVAKVQQGQTSAGKILLLVQGTGEGNMPKALFMLQRQEGVTTEAVEGLSDNDLKLWCENLKSTLKQQQGVKNSDVLCEKGTTRVGSALSTRMSIPTGNSDMLRLTWTLPKQNTCLVATVLYPKADEEKYLPQIKTMLESIHFAKNK